MGHRPITEERIAGFWAKVDRSGGEDACWPWTLSKTRFGHGSAQLSQFKGAHCIAWMLYYGFLIPKGKQVCHSCDNPPCCNPKHLWIGTAKDNARDRNTKGRFRGGRKRKVIDLQAVNI
jgi:hypothetical protein